MKSMKNFYQRAKDYGSKVLAGALLVGALSGCSEFGSRVDLIRKIIKEKYDDGYRNNVESMVLK